jgi:hypothetical protein
MLASPTFLRGSAPRCTPWTSSTAFLQPIFLCRLGKSTCRRLRSPNRSHHAASPAAVGCVSRSHGSLGKVTSLVVGSCHVDLTPSSRSRTHQNQARQGEQSPLSLPLPHRYATGERSKKRRLIGPIETGGCRHRHGKCRPSGPEERWRNTMVQFTKSMDKKPPTTTPHGRDARAT